MAPNPAPSARLVLSTAGSRDEAEKIARTLVERRLAACVNLIPNLTSVYSWQGAIETAHEVLMLIKTSAERLPELETALREMHSYDVPEFVVIALESGNQAYLDWLAAAVAPLSP